MPTQENQVLVWWLAGIVVIPLLLTLVIGVPWQIWLDRDLALNGRAVTATATAQSWMETKSGSVRVFDLEYVVAGRLYTTRLSADVSGIGMPVQLRFAPHYPRHARLDVPPVLPWDHDLSSRLATAYGLAVVFGTTWVVGLRAAYRQRARGRSHRVE